MELSGGCLAGVLWMSRGCLDCVWTEYKGCLNGILVNQDW